MPTLNRLLPLLLAGAISASGGGLTVQIANAQTVAEPAPAEVSLATDLAGAREMSRKALAIGRPDVTASIARQTLAVVPDDLPSHMFLAAALTRMGQAEQAIPVARKGFRLAERPEEKFEAAWLIAEASALSNRPWLSKFWLRRADLYATSKDHEAVLQTAYRNVSTLSPLSFAVSFFAGPSDNVNGGSLHDTFWYYNIPIPIEQALPGHVWGGGLQVGYRLGQNTGLQLSWAHRGVVLGDRAKALAPTARAGDYRQDYLGLGGRHIFILDGAGRTAAELSLGVGRRWTGGRAAADFQSGAVSLKHLVGKDLIIGGKFALENTDQVGESDIDSLTRRLGLTVGHRNGRFGAVQVDLDAVEVDSQAAGIAWRGPSLSATWVPPVESDSFGFSVDLLLERRDYWITPWFEPDMRSSLSLTTELKSLEVMGFSPTVTLSAARTKSDVIVRDTRDLGVSFGISSSF